VIYRGQTQQEEERGRTAEERQDSRGGSSSFIKTIVYAKLSTVLIWLSCNHYYMHIYYYLHMLPTEREARQQRRKASSRGEIKGLEAMTSPASDGRIKEVMPLGQGCCAAYTCKDVTGMLYWLKARLYTRQQSREASSIGERQGSRGETGERPAA
jgi:hypothetical protein